MRKKSDILLMYAVKPHYIRGVEKMVNFRVNYELVAEFDRVAMRHNRTRTQELTQLMIDDIRMEKPDYQPPERNQP